LTREKKRLEKRYVKKYENKDDGSVASCNEPRDQSLEDISWRSGQAKVFGVSRKVA
jgi:hypothetical protein